MPQYHLCGPPQAYGRRPRCGAASPAPCDPKPWWRMATKVAVPNLTTVPGADPPPTPTRARAGQRDVLRGHGNPISAVTSSRQWPSGPAAWLRISSVWTSPAQPRRLPASERRPRHQVGPEPHARVAPQRRGFRGWWPTNDAGNGPLIAGGCFGVARHPRASRDVRLPYSGTGASRVFRDGRHFQPAISHGLPEDLVVALRLVRVGGGEVGDRLVEPVALAEVAADLRRLTGAGVGVRQRSIRTVRRTGS